MLAYVPLVLGKRSGSVTGQSGASEGVDDMQYPQSTPSWQGQPIEQFQQRLPPTAQQPPAVEQASLMAQEAAQAAQQAAQEATRASESVQQSSPGSALNPLQGQRLPAQRQPEFSFQGQQHPVGEASVRHEPFQVGPPQQGGTAQAVQQHPAQSAARGMAYQSTGGASSQGTTRETGQGQQGQQLQLAPQQPVPATSPYVDVYDSTEALLVFADIPGATKEDVRIEGNERTLHIIAERKLESEEEEFTPVQQERLRRVERTIQLPTDVNVEDAEATCKNGVCKVSLPKNEQRTIGVQ